jgi:hypothetical protein
MHKNTIARVQGPRGSKTTALLAAGLLAAGLGGCGGDAGNGGGTPEANPLLQGITTAHNMARSSVMPAASTPIPALQWSTAIAAQAQAWADNCQFQHSGGNYGENIYADTGQGTVNDVVADWVGERQDYDYATNSCSGTCGHYTQVVWARSLNLGCGVAHCTKNSPFGGPWNFWVCNYDPAGNLIGQRPY